jgi:hypothetical protein
MGIRVGVICGTVYWEEMLTIVEVEGLVVIILRVEMGIAVERYLEPIMISIAQIFKPFQVI